MNKKTPKCSKGFPCGKSCISRNNQCWANLSSTNNKVAETFSQFVNRLVGIDTPIQSDNPLDNIAKEKIKHSITRNDIDSLEKNLISKAGLTSTEVINAKENLNEIIRDRKIAINLPVPVLGLLLNGDRKFKNQFETGTSQANLDNELRLEVEKNVCGINNDIDFELRPKYGHLINDKNPPGDNNYHANPYGEMQFIFKDNIKDQSTITFGDSITNSDNAIATKVNDPKLVGLFPKFLKNLASLNKQDLYSKSVSEISKLLTNNQFFLEYIEVQIHGEINLSDIEQINIPNSMIDSPEIKQLKEKYPNIIIKTYD